MKNLTLFLGLALLFFVAACKNESPQEIQVLEPFAFHQALDHSENIQLIDVRTSEEFSAGHLKNAVNIDVLESNFTSEVEKLNLQKPVYLYCRSGKRSAKAAAILKEVGFKQIYDLEGGYLQWEENDLPRE